MCEGGATRSLDISDQPVAVVAYPWALVSCSALSLGQNGVGMAIAGAPVRPHQVCNQLSPYKCISGHIHLGQLCLKYSILGSLEAVTIVLEGK